MGPRPAPYTDFLKNWFPSGSVGYKYGQESFGDVESYIKTEISKGNPVIALGSEGGQAHYFAIVGFGKQGVKIPILFFPNFFIEYEVVYVLDNSGNLGYVSYSFYKDFLGVSIPSVSGYSCWSV